MPVPGLLSETVRHTHEGDTRGELPHLGIKFALSVGKKSRALMKALKLPMELVTYETVAGHDSDRTHPQVRSPLRGR